MNIPEEFLNAIEILIDKRMQNTAQIYTGRIVSSSGSKCVVNINGRNQIVQFYGSAPTVNSMYRVFVPQNNMSMAFIITGGDSSSPTPTPGTTDYDVLKNLPSINNITLSGNKNSDQLNLYGNDNPPPYPVTSVNEQSGAVVLDANDIGAYTKEEVSSLLLKKPNPNLLDNWYFANPVNQRNHKDAIGAHAYSIDRWLLEYSTYFDVMDGYMRLHGYWGVGQGFENTLPDGTYTFSALVRNVTGSMSLSFNSDFVTTISSKTFDASVIGTDWTLVSFTTTVSGCKWARLSSDGTETGGVDTLAVKLELGDQQTLAHQDADGNWVLNEILDYGERLARCQRYFISDQQRDCYGRYSGNSFYVVCPTPVSLRTMPTISISAMGQVVDRNGIGHSVNGISPVVLGDSSVLLVVTIVDTSVPGPAVLMDAHFSLSADL